MTTSQNDRAYGYRRFTPEEYDFKEDTGLKTGDFYQDVTLKTVDFKDVRLSDYLGDKPLVLETGSMTCPMYAQSVPPMMDLIKKYPQFDHVLIYVREAHPGELQPQHRSQGDKLSAARISCRRYGDTRTTLVDDVEGSAHKFYGTMPNSIYIIAPDGEILFRSIWNNADEMDDILRDIAEGKAIEPRELKAVPPFSFGAVRTLFMGGTIAVWDFIRSLPRLVGNHKEVGNM